MRPGNNKHQRDPAALHPKYHRMMLDELAGALGAPPPVIFFGSRTPNPLKIGIAQDLVAAYPKAQRADVKLWLRKWTGTTAYLTALIHGDNRRNMTGHDAGHISDSDRIYARKRLGFRKRQNGKTSRPQHVRTRQPRQNDKAFREQTSVRDAYKDLASKAAHRDGAMLVKNQR